MFQVWIDYPLPAEELEIVLRTTCLLYTSDAADERSSVDLGGRRIIKKKKRARHNRQVYIALTESQIDTS